MNEIIDLILTFSQELKEIKARIKLSIAERLKITWIDYQDVILTLPISKKTLKTIRKDGEISFSKVQNKFYYKISDLEELLQSNYYNLNFKCDEVK
jgi:ribosomal protein L28